MKTNSFFYTEFTEACSKIGISPTPWLQSNGFSSSTVTNLKTCARPTLQTLHSIVNKFEDRTIRLKLIRGYLMDEIGRIDVPDVSQLDLLVDITENVEQDDSQESIFEDLQILQVHSKSRTVSQLLRDVALIFRGLGSSKSMSDEK